MSSRASTVPVGLLGVQSQTIFAPASIAAQTPGTSSAKPVAASSGTRRTAAPWMRAATAYMPKVGGQTTTESCPATQNTRVTRSMASSLPRPTSTCDGSIPHAPDKAFRSPGGCGCG